ncbi:MAG: hypothetical protein BWY74_04476 [Firmicutes bacterium ADurb.Bin419]|nr:MAG: hypothetical protein BWY74_04476 [Firmicutes bacterium ADurb.Bin419]
MTASIPLVEVSYNTDPFCTWSPNGKKSTFNTVYCHKMTSQFIIYSMMSSLVKEMKIVVRDNRQITVRIVYHDSGTVIVDCLKCIFEKVVSFVKDNFKEATFINYIHAVTDIGLGFNYIYFFCIR